MKQLWLTLIAISLLAACAKVGDPIAKGQNCGIIAMSGGTNPQYVMSNDGGKSEKQAMACFLDAFQQCRTATLAIRDLAIDAGVQHTFRVESQNGNCTLTDQFQNWATYDYGNSPPLGTVTCTGLVEKDGGLLFAGCSHIGDFFVPAPQS